MLDELRKIGFNDHLDIDGDVLHVQTEVLGRGELKIRTTVYRKGVVQLSESSRCETEGVDVQQVRATVEAQHRRIVAQVSGA